MLNRTIRLFLCLGLIGGISSHAGAQITVQLLKVRIQKHERTFTIGSSGACSVKDLESGISYRLKNNHRYVVRAIGRDIVMSGKTLSPRVEIISENVESRIMVNGVDYRGNIAFFDKEGRLSAVNELDVELYLYGVLPKEVIALWPEESLKSQAVISRSFALKNLSHHSKEGYDLCDTTHCQVYGGVESEHRRTNDAVNKTRGEVLFYEGKLASTFFHGSCGGHTENIEDVWGGKAPEYLRGRSVKYANSPAKDYWKNGVGESLVRRKLNEAGYDVGEIHKIRMVGRTRSGRTKELKIQGDRGTAEVQAGKFRVMVDPWKIKSTLFEDISRDGDSFVFSGYGWGHGVGLCQESAKNMALNGYNYENILKYFYPGTYLAKWDEEEHS